jgi:hypothetical protein
LFDHHFRYWIKVAATVQLPVTELSSHILTRDNIFILLQDIATIPERCPEFHAMLFQKFVRIFTHLLCISTTT